MTDKNEVAALLDRFAQLRVAVVGDFFLDKYLILDPSLSETSIETGLEARQVVAIRCSPGAAGTVTNNLSALGVATIYAVGFTGDDGEGYDLRKGLHTTGVLTEHLQLLPDRFTPTYTKPMVMTATGEREIERLDIKNRLPLPSRVEDRVIADMTALMESGSVDAVLVADQVQERNCGVVTDRVRSALKSLGYTSPIVIMADSRVRIGEFSQVIVKPNAAEAASAVGMTDPLDDLAETAAVGRRLASRNGRPVFITLGPNGIMACDRDSAVHVPALPVRGEIDIVGAGDSAFAGIVCALAVGGSLEQAALVGNLCASVTIHKLGTTGTASAPEIMALLS